MRKTARFLALWMSYEDVIRVADLKTRRTQLEKDIDRQDLTEAGGLAARIKQAREAALADPEGRKLAQALGLPVPEPAFKPINFVRNKRAA